MSLRLRPLPVVALALATLLSSAAPAATVQRRIFQLAPGICGANNPANDSQLRRLANGLRNSGTSTISVVCTLWGDDGTVAAASAVQLYFGNNKATGATLACTLTMGLPLSSQTTSTKSQSVAGYGINALLEWNTGDYGTSGDAQWATLQCSLPPGITLNEISMTYLEDVGM
jgi:hypothetical protein